MQAAARLLACAALSHAAPAASVVRGVNSPDDVLAGAVVTSSDEAQRLGIVEGMTGAEALEVMRAHGRARGGSKL